MRAALCLLAAAFSGSARAGPISRPGLKETSSLGFSCTPHCEQSDPLWRQWETAGSANVASRSVVLTEDEQNQAGTFWSRQLFVAPEWELEMSFRVFGAGEVGADGFALWFTRDGKDEGTREAGDKGSHDAVDAFGHQNRWRGLGLFFDSYDNDNYAEHTVGVSGLKVGNNGRAPHLAVRDMAASKPALIMTRTRLHPFPQPTNCLMFKRLLNRAVSTTPRVAAPSDPRCRKQWRQVLGP